MARARSARSGRWRLALRWLGVVVLLGAAATGLYAVYLDQQIRERFEGQRWALPARVYARPLELYAGAPLARDTLLEALARLGYRERRALDAPATYVRTGSDLVLRTRGFDFPEGKEEPVQVRIAYAGGRVADITHSSGGSAALVRLEPELIGGFFPATLEDRLLVRLEELPPLLPQALLLLEDRQFYAHRGVSVRGIARALLADLRAGRVVQGGSTITQQLVKNFFLNAERTVWRKFTEALMAVMLELHYDKNEILEAYLNEVYLGQVGRHSVHGVAQGSLLHFGRPVQELEPGDLALLAGMVRAPSAYDPRRHPQRARARRDHVLALLAEHGLLDPQTARAQTARPLETSPAPRALTRYPAFLDLVRRQLARDYPDARLRRDGLRVFSTLDPVVQAAAEAAVASSLGALARQRSDPALQGALVAAHAATGEVLAIVGARDPAAEGFNRALDARRQIGSLVKPAVYLAALAHPDRYHWLRTVPDRPLEVPLAGGRVWKPRNDDGAYAGEVTLLTALVQSRNVPTVNLGLEVGVGEVVRALRTLGVERKLAPHPAVLLGAVDLTPYEAAQLYQALASGGFSTPLRGIQAVTDAAGVPITRYPLRARQAADPATVYLVTAALAEATRTGTGRRLRELLPGVTVAGKTGTSSEQRDSWFAGFTADLVAVTWVGHDDNSPTGLYGASGALLVWSALMRALPVESLQLAAPAGIEWVAAAPKIGMPAPACAGGFGVPVRSPPPAGLAVCGVAQQGWPGADAPARAWRWLREMF
jgi:penicillin-binding protein 1B